MGMKFKAGRDPATAIRDIQRASKLFEAAALSAFNEGAEQIRDTAKEFVPVDQGHMEEAIKLSPPRVTGPGVISRSIYVDENVADVQDYVTWLHEGSYKLGPKSEAKAARSGQQVGPKFLKRAADKILPEMRKKIAAAMKGASVRATFRRG